MDKRTVIVSVLAVATASVGGLAFGGSADRSDQTAQGMIAQERGWAEQSCGMPWVLADLLADDFHGTAPNGSRYDKPKDVPSYDPATLDTDCRLLDAVVRFFGADVAVVYGSESSVVALADGERERHCLAWTDTWLRRNGKWQIIAVQDSRVDCPTT